MMWCDIWYDVIYVIWYDIRYDVLYVIWYDIYDVMWYDMIYDVMWYMIWCDICYIWYLIWCDICYIWYLIWCDILYIISDMMWYVIYIISDIMWYVIYDIWYDMMWYMLYDMIYMIWYIWYVMIWCDMMCVAVVQYTFTQNNLQHRHKYLYVTSLCQYSWLQWPRGLRRWSAATRLLGLWVRIPPECGYLVEVSATGWSSVQRNPTDCGASEFDREASIM
jgi:hypothetical protein